MNSDSEISARITRFETVVATCLSMLPFLFAGQCLLAIGVTRTSEGMFRDFGAHLPSATQFALSWRPAWIAIAIALPLAAIVLSRIKPPVTSVVFSTAAGLLLFVIAQFLTYANWLPLVELTQTLSR